MFLSVNGTSQSYGWEPKDQASFRNAGPGEAPCRAYGIIGADERRRMGLDAQGL
jgi:hypothetical protein